MLSILERTVRVKPSRSVNNLMAAILLPGTQLRRMRCIDPVVMLGAGSILL